MFINIYIQQQSHFNTYTNTNKRKLIFLPVIVKINEN